MRTINNYNLYTKMLLIVISIADILYFKIEDVGVWLKNVTCH